MVKMLGYVVSCVLLLLVEKLVFGIFIRIIIYSFLCAYLMSIICFVEFALVCVSKYAFCNSLYKIQFFFSSFGCFFKVLYSTMGSSVQEIFSFLSFQIDLEKDQNDCKLHFGVRLSCLAIECSCVQIQWK